MSIRLTEPPEQRPEAILLAQTVREVLLSGQRHTTALGRWSLSRRCVFMSHPRACPPGEPDRNPYGRPRFSSGHWILPLFRPARAFRRAVQHPAAPIGADWSELEVAIIAQLSAGSTVTLAGLGTFDRVSIRDQLRPRFRFAEPLRRLIGAEQVRLLGGSVQSE